MFSPSLENVKKIGKNKEFKRIPISYELFSDMATPIEVLRILKGISNHVYMLESVEDSQIDIFEDLGVLISDVAQVLFAKSKKNREAEKKDAINTIVSILSKVVNL
jgi:hypothetical protein